METVEIGRRKNPPLSILRAARMAVGSALRQRSDGETEDKRSGRHRIRPANPAISEHPQPAPTRGRHKRQPDAQPQRAAHPEPRGRVSNVLLFSPDTPVPRRKRYAAAKGQTPQAPAAIEQPVAIAEAQPAADETRGFFGKLMLHRPDSPGKWPRPQRPQRARHKKPDFKNPFRHLREHKHANGGAVIGLSAGAGLGVLATEAALKLNSKLGAPEMVTAIAERNPAAVWPVGAGLGILTVGIFIAAAADAGGNQIDKENDALAEMPPFLEQAMADDTLIPRPAPTAAYQHA